MTGHSGRSTLAAPRGGRRVIWGVGHGLGESAWSSLQLPTTMGYPGQRVGAVLPPRVRNRVISEVWEAWRRPNWVLRPLRQQLCQQRPGHNGREATILRWLSGPFRGAFLHDCWGWSNQRTQDPGLWTTGFRIRPQPLPVSWSRGSASRDPGRKTQACFVRLLLPPGGEGLEATLCLQSGCWGP